ncbi:hypothetical protein [Streptococcus equinus]|uniref:DUF536 domain-containing protein n=1 Tax=Streptococcus equinus TaxID=1335 RepID=A0AAE8HMH3_STREI|nr:hypothetical protein [Streptococcus equinus]SDX17191.1 hypothetical protein SAMN05216415_1906 [Streptococcus equinus]
MSKTTRELAELFGLSKQAIEKKYTPEFKAKYMSKVTTNGVPTWLVADEGVNVLKSVFLGTNQTTNLGANGVPTDDKILGVLEEQIKSQKNQIESLQKLLDQSQQLLLSEQKKSQSLIESHKTTIKFDDYLAEQLKNDDFKQVFLKEKEKLDKQIALYQAKSREANQTAKENEYWAIRAEKAFWFAAILAGVFFILLLILGWIYLTR